MPEPTVPNPERIREETGEQKTRIENIDEAHQTANAMNDRINSDYDYNTSMQQKSHLSELNALRKKHLKELDDMDKDVSIHSPNSLYGIRRDTLNETSERSREIHKIAESAQLALKKLAQEPQELYEANPGKYKNMDPGEFLKEYERYHEIKLEIKNYTYTASLIESLIRELTHRIWNKSSDLKNLPIPLPAELNKRNLELKQMFREKKSMVNTALEPDVYEMGEQVMVDIRQQREPIESFTASPKDLLENWLAAAEKTSQDIIRPKLEELKNSLHGLISSPTEPHPQKTPEPTA